ncbi:hypothetical protein [Methanococcus voltae]|uniref:Uncharacterized protein n=1 Tax=Methanococcus voltae TaxID=2188 RepID=A0A8J7RM39_METVO|nr:hypothetical protein [Methanococcus voltae]MBP2173308.1 hypothetical protein [Methanococcus voltae]MBP2201366.1 hypothetical protein [Methanococcus voltae]
MEIIANNKCILSNNLEFGRSVRFVSDSLKQIAHRRADYLVNKEDTPLPQKIIYKGYSFPATVDLCVPTRQGNNLGLEILGKIDGWNYVIISQRPKDYDLRTNPVVWEELKL